MNEVFPNHLVIVCGHGTYRGEGDPWQEESWVLEPFRKSDASTNKPGEHTTFVQHILAGAAILDQDPQALLIFSGAKTQNEVDTTEAESYAQAFARLRGGLERTSCDVYATDSYQNLFFSLLRFRVITGRYPDFITIITHAFKEMRFLALHAPAIQWPPDKIRLIGINPSFTLNELQQVQQAERKNAFTPFVDDLFGVRPPLIDKKMKRGWNADAVMPMLTKHEQNVQRLAAWDGGSEGNAPFPEPLPWTS